MKLNKTFEDESLSTCTLADEILSSYLPLLGPDFEAYRNHVCRVCRFCMALSGTASPTAEKIMIVAAFHDLGIWTANTFDYLPHSTQLAMEYLDGRGQSAWNDEIVTMIGEHHKLTPWRGRPEWLVEPFRKADLIDLSLGLFRFGLDAGFIRTVFRSYPNAGFHRKLVKLSLRRLKTHPFDPFPMVKW
ncbi:MAG: phosphohydrolase [Chlorobiaceae bacterium]|nr:phosphohydrolase [Chlorobiaceae bacterium]